MLGPFGFAYVLFLVPRASVGIFYDRYLLPLQVICLLVLTRLYQRQERTNLPIACVALITLGCLLGVTATHNEFALYRGYAAAIDEIRSSGVPAISILGPWEYDSWTVVEKVGYVKNPRIRIPKGAYSPPPAGFIPANCHVYGLEDFDLEPPIKPVYIVSKSPIGCGGSAGLPPVTYHKWFSARASPIYVVKLTASSGH